MAKFYLTNQALEDLTEIWNKTFEEFTELYVYKDYQILFDNRQEITNNSG